MVNDDLLIQDDFVIEGFDPDKLAELKKEASKGTGWQKILGAYQNQKILKGRVRGIQEIGKMTCAIVMVEDVRGIIALEDFGVDSKRQMRNYVGDEIVFRVVEYVQEEGIFYASRTQARNQMAEITLRRVEEGDTIPFVVGRVNAGGLYGDVGGIEAHLPIDEIRYGWIDNPYDEFKKGDHMLVQVSEIEDIASAPEDAGKSEKHRFLVSAKALLSNPWAEGDIALQLPEGSEHEGVVTGVTDYGVFISLLDGVDSLAPHLRFENAKKGDRVVVRILDVDIQKERVRSRILQIK